MSIPSASTKPSRISACANWRAEVPAPPNLNPGKPAPVDFHSSTMKVELALLHEEDLLRFLSDLRDSGNAYYSVRRCDVSRTGQALSGATMTPRLRANCEIELITIRDGAAKR